MEFDLGQESPWLVVSAVMVQSEKSLLITAVVVLVVKVVEIYVFIQSLSTE